MVNKNKMVAKLKSIYLEQGQVFSDNFEKQALTLSMGQLAIEISLAQAGL
ncbi:hypothetical protein AB6M97_08905 [Streptococcus hillyeri]